jgi:hypothetical protein
MNNNHNMLVNCARWINEECGYFGIPIVRLSASEAQGSGRGVCQHVDLGSGGGGHWDCGSGFPMDYVLDMARSNGGTQPEEEEDRDMITSAVAHNGSLHVFWVGEDRQTVRYEWQRKGESEWKDGGVLTKAPKKISGLSATKSASNILELFALYDDGTPAHLWQRGSDTEWSGGEKGEQVAGFVPLPK